MSLALVWSIDSKKQSGKKTKDTDKIIKSEKISWGKNKEEIELPISKTMLFQCSLCLS